MFIFCMILIQKMYGGEGGIRTPDSLTTMPDFESGAFNRALPPLRFIYNEIRPCGKAFPALVSVPAPFREAFAQNASTTLQAIRLAPRMK